MHRPAALVLLSLAVMGCAGDDGAPSPPAAAELVAAAERGDVARIEELLARGAAVDGRDARNRTAVTAAALGDHVSAARALIEAGADVDLQDDNRNNPLLVCGETGNVALLRVVLAAGPDLGATNRFGGTALIPASDRGHVELLRELLATEIDLDHVNRLGWTALLEAIILGEGGEAHTEIVRLLVTAGADVDLADGDGVRPLEHARERGFTEIATILMAAGAA